jgi:predicted SAM-dependent methyltransferase
MAALLQLGGAFLGGTRLLQSMAKVCDCHPAPFWTKRSDGSRKPLKRGGTTLAARRRITIGQTYFRGAGIDVGGGHDGLEQYAELLGFDTCRNWDMPDGDAQFLASVPDAKYDFLHSSHCLEHMEDPVIALGNWIRVVRPGGYIVITVPDEEMYEHLHWPSRYNPDHKWSFTLYQGRKRLPKSINIFDLLTLVWEDITIIKTERIEAGYRYDLGDTDQTALAIAECAIEVVLRKN